MGVLGSLPPLKEFFKIQGSCQTPDTGGLTFSVNVSIKSQQAMKTAMTPMSFAGIRPFVWPRVKTMLMRRFCLRLDVFCSVMWNKVRISSVRNQYPKYSENSCGCGREFTCVISSVTL